MARMRFPLLALALLSVAVATALVLSRGTGPRGEARSSHPFGRDRVAVVDISGVITGSHEAGQATASARRVIEQLEKHGEDDSVRAVVLRIDSPGGTVVAAQEMHAAVLRLRRDRGKTVVASMGDLAASGGYYVACAAERVWASPGTLTGSIGVVMQFPDLRGLMGKIGVGATTVKSGEFKDIGNSFREVTPREREVLQELVDDVHGQFIHAVAEGRSLPVERVRAIADGRIWSGRQALALDLVDELGDLDAAIAGAGRLAGIPGKPEVVRERRRVRIWELFESRLGSLLPSPLATPWPGGQARLLYLWD